MKRRRDPGSDGLADGIACAVVGLWVGLFGGMFLGMPIAWWLAAEDNTGIAFPMGWLSLSFLGAVLGGVWFFLGAGRAPAGRRSGERGRRPQ